MATIPYTTGLQLLLDARTIGGNDGDAVSAWTDQSGQGNNGAQSNATYKPVYKTNIYGSFPAVRFGSVAGSHLIGNIASWGSITGYTLLMARSNLPTSQPAVGGFFGIARSGVADYSIFSHLMSTAWFYVNGSDIAASIPSIPLTTPASSSTPFVHGLSVDATTVKLVANGIFYSAAHSVTLSSSVPTTWNMGALNNGSISTANYTKYDCFLVALYNGVLSAANLELVVAWMQSELGIRTASGGLTRSRNMTGGMSA